MNKAQFSQEERRANILFMNSNQAQRNSLTKKPYILQKRPLALQNLYRIFVQFDAKGKYLMTSV